MGLALILFKSRSEHLKVGPEHQKSEVALHISKMALNISNVSPGASPGLLLGSHWRTLMNS